MKIENITNSKHLPFVIIAALSFALYSNTLLNDFLYDDVFQILNNKWITDIRYIPDILFTKTWGFNTDHPLSNYYRPMMHLVFMAEYHIFGLEPWGWHLVNIIFHTMNGLMVYIIFSTLFNTEAKNKGADIARANIIPLIAALIFVAHPINTEVTAWVSAIPELSFTLFLLASFYLYLRFMDNGTKTFLIISALFFFLSTLSKETSIVLPILIVAYDIIFRDKNAKNISFPFRYIPYAVVMIVYFILRINALHGMTPKPWSHPYLDGFQYFINAFTLFALHIKMLLLPAKLSTFHVFHPAYSITEIKAIFSILVTIFVLILFYKLKKRSILFLFGLCLIIIPLLPALFIPALDRNPFAERYLYLPGTGFALIIALLFKEALDYFSTKKENRIAGFILIAFLLLIGAYSVGTIKRNFEWKDNYSLWKSTIKKTPQNYFALNELARLYLIDKKPDKAIPLFKASIESNKAMRNPDPLLLGLANLSLADSFRLANKPIEAIFYYEEVIRMDAGRFDANLQAAILYHEEGDLDLAIARYQTALERAEDKGDITGILMNIGNIFAEKKEWDKALDIYSKAQGIDPGNRTLIQNIRLIEKKRSMQNE